MKISLFGKTLFETQSNGAQMWQLGSSETKESKYLPDFMESNNEDSIFSSVITLQEVGGEKKTKKPKAEKPKPSRTPKDVYNLKMLHDKAFKLNTDPAYVDKQIADFKAKLDLISKEEYDMRRGVKEISSIVLRMENRKKYAANSSTFENYPYTTTSKVNDVIGKHSNLKLGQIAQFIADMPKEATDAMKEYNKATQALCSKDAVFYIIADKKDFKKSDKRRDPILLAQSPFGHVWQILGAWDDEMLFLEEL